MGTEQLLNRDGLRSLCFCAAIAVVVALAFVGCGGGDSTDGSASDGSAASTAAESTSAESESTSRETTNPPPESSSPPGSAVSTGIPGKIGRVVVSQVGFTFYTPESDVKDSGKSSCYGKCAELWVPYLTEGPPTAAAKADAALIGTLERKDGTTQVTYGGWPLYTYAPDPSAATGGTGRQSFGTVWNPIDVTGGVVIR